MAGLSSLQALRVLDLSDNPLGGSTNGSTSVSCSSGGAASDGALPDDVAQLPALASLAAANCDLRALPSTLGGAQQRQLAIVSVGGNRLQELPAGLSCARALGVLRAAGGELRQLPGSMVAGWTSLRELNLANNKLTVCGARCVLALSNAQHALPIVCRACCAAAAVPSCKPGAAAINTVHAMHRPCQTRCPACKASASSTCAATRSRRCQPASGAQRRLQTCGLGSTN